MIQYIHKVKGNNQIKKDEVMKNDFKRNVSGIFKIVRQKGNV